MGEGDGKKKILEGTYRNAATNNTVVIGPASSPDDCNILVHPIFDGGGTGTVNLTISMAADCNIKCLKAVWEVQADDGTKTKTFTDGGSNLTSATFTMTADGEASSGIPAGFHRVDFYFYGDEGGTDELYSCTQYLNVFENLTTDLWRNNGATPYIDDDGNFMLTRSVIYNRKLFYVQKRDDSEKGEGTRYSPFDSVQTAVQKILAANDGVSEYKIALLSDDTDESTSSYTADTLNSYICINPDKPLKLIIESDVFESRDTNEGNPFTINAARTDGKTGRVMYIGQNAEVTLKNVSITGGYASGTGGDVSTTIGGGGLCVCDADAITLGSGLIADNRAAAGGGIYFEGSGTDAGGTVMFTMSGTTVSGNTAAYTSAISYSGDGGGIYIDGSSVEMTACTIGGSETAEGNSAEKRGGGIYSTGKLTVSGGTLTLTGGTISRCISDSAGGGIYSSGALSLDGCMIGGDSESDGNSASVGGGISLYGGTLSFTGSTTTIKNCTAKTYGGGIYIKTAAAAAISDCTISTCTAAASGGGISNGSDNVTISDCIVTGCTAATSGGGIYNDVSDTSITCTLTDCTISGCKATGTASGQGGGGICNIAGTLELTDVNITGGDSANPDARSGGGIYNKGTLKVTGGTIKNCTSLYAGGGVYNSAGTLKITDGTISTCITKEGRGGGICSSGNGVSAEIKDCIIQSCEAATSSGGGISNETGTLTMSGGTITGNTAAKSGGGVYNTGTFTMGGSASVPAGDDGKNDVYLASGKTIGIASTLTATTPVATITPNAYTEGTAVLSAADGSTATLAANYEKFAVTAESDGTEWLIASDGTLKLSVPEGFVRVEGGTVVGKANTNNYAGVFIAGRTVTLKSFYMCDHEVTQGEWEEVMTGNTANVDANPSYCTAASSATYGVNFGTNQKNRPVEGVTWYDAVYYCNIRSEKEGLTKAYDISGITQSGGHITAATVSLVSDADGYRLPTEAEWEFAARGGDPDAAAWDYTFSGAATASGTGYSASVNSGLDSVGWYKYNNKTGTTTADSQTDTADGKGTHEVKQKAANALGLYDMSGNVWEWCWDWSGSISTGTETDPTGSASGSNRVNRGGSWYNDAYYCTVSYRDNILPNYRYYSVGFRVVRSSSE